MLLKNIFPRVGGIICGVYCSSCSIYVYVKPPYVFLKLYNVGAHKHLYNYILLGVSSGCSFHLILSFEVICRNCPFDIIFEIIMGLHMRHSMVMEEFMEIPWNDEAVWKKFKEAGFDEYSIKRRGKAPRSPILLNSKSSNFSQLRVFIYLFVQSFFIFVLLDWFSIFFVPVIYFFTGCKGWRNNSSNF